MADYSEYQGPNPEWIELLRTTILPPSGLRPGLETPEELRDLTNATREQTARLDLENAGLLNKVQWKDHQVPTRDASVITARVYKPKELLSSSPIPVYLYYHGGGYLMGTVASDDAICSRIVDASPIPLMVLSVNYRHTPEFKHPTQHNDAWDSFEWLSRSIEDLGGDRSRVIVGGISAGGGLAASVVIRANQDEWKQGRKLQIHGQVLCIPWIAHPQSYPFHLLASKEKSSYVQNIDAPILPRRNHVLFADLLDVNDPTDIYMSPLLAPDAAVKGLPKTVFLVAGQDPLRDEGLLYAETLKANRTPTTVHVFPGLPHGFRRFASLASALSGTSVLIRVSSGASEIVIRVRSRLNGRLQIHYRITNSTWPNTGI
ncbi:hypothetical protein V502_03203 [Pseudogymnoascus sp. VKM F-4520 (FW-2644)]|nr:hypothetical protein V502_03203 [Pseudogymnoascus sp. VKM F-4520 (FW-2644)]